MADGLWYFAYGANMNAAVLRRREVSPSRSVRARAPGRRLAFHHRGGFADLPREGSVTGDGAWGVAHRITRDELRRLARFETGYRVEEIAVLNVDTDPPENALALAFVSEPAFVLPAEVPPTDEYKEKLLQGALACGLPAEAIEPLAAIRSVPADRRGPEHFDTPSSGAAQVVVGVAVAAALALYLRP